MSNEFKELEKLDLNFHIFPVVYLCGQPESYILIKLNKPERLEKCKNVHADVLAVSQLRVESISVSITVL